MGGAEGRSFENLFRSADGARDNFLSRLFGIFSEDVVRYWSRNPNAPYEDLGRPTIHTEGQWHTLDFTLRNRRTGHTYATEMKCELSYEGYRYLRLVDCEQLRHHGGQAFRRFLELARPDHGFTVKVAGQPLHTDGAILVWGATSAAGAEAVRERFGLADVLSVEEMLADLHRWHDDAWKERASELRGWSNELFDYLIAQAR